MSRLYKSGTTPKIPIFISAAATLVPVSGLGGGTVYLINSSSAAVVATNTLVEIDATHAKGWYYVLVDAADSLIAGNWTLSYQTPSTFANIGKTEFTVDAPVLSAATQNGLSGLFAGGTNSPTLNVTDFVTNLQEIASVPDLNDSGDTTVNTSLMSFIRFMFQMLREKLKAEADKVTLYAKDGVSPIAEATMTRNTDDPDNPIVTRSRFETPA